VHRTRESESATSSIGDETTGERVVIVLDPSATEIVLLRLTTDGEMDVRKGPGTIHRLVRDVHHDGQVRRMVVVSLFFFFK
jgi:hypothetical protein